MWLFVGSVDDEIEHEGPAFNVALAEAGYTVDVVAADGYTVTFDAARLNRNNDILVAYKVNENPLPEEYFPLRLVGPEMPKKEMVGQIVSILVNLGAAPADGATEVPATEPAATEPATGGTVPVTVTEAESQLVGFRTSQI